MSRQKRKSHNQLKYAVITWEESFKSGGGWVLGILSFLFLAVFVWGFFRKWENTRGSFIKSSSWVQTQGTITHSNLAHHSGNVKSGRYIIPVIRYQYQVAGKTYYSHKIGFRSYKSLWFNRGIAEQYVSKYPVGRTVTVYYLPSEPGVSVLEPTHRNIAGFLVQVAFILLALTGVVFSIWGHWYYNYQRPRILQAETTVPKTHTWRRRKKRKSKPELT